MDSANDTANLIPDCQRLEYNHRNQTIRISAHKYSSQLIGEVIAGWVIVVECAPTTVLKTFQAMLQADVLQSADAVKAAFTHFVGKQQWPDSPEKWAEWPWYRYITAMADKLSHVVEPTPVGTHSRIVSLVSRSTITRAVQFDGSEESLEAIDQLTQQRQYAAQKHHADMMGFFWLTPRHQVNVGDYVALPKPGHANIISAAEISTTYCIDGQLNFSQAVQAMLNGKGVRRRSFAENVRHLSLSAAQTGQLIIQNDTGGFAYELQPDDLVATDWCLVEDDKPAVL